MQSRALPVHAEERQPSLKHIHRSTSRHALSADRWMQPEISMGGAIEYSPLAVAMPLVRGVAGGRSGVLDTQDGSAQATGLGWRGAKATLVRALRT